MTELKKGQILESGFEIIEVVDLPDFGANGIWAKHQKSGAEVFHILNDNEDNFFAFVFVTPPKDSTGAAHILEHMVFCGSESYPLKQPINVLEQSALHNYFRSHYPGANTYADKTIYSCCSENEKEYFNFMAVYGDAVFRPLLSEWAFMQEGHHLFIAPDGKLHINGVVYNEMKGMYSSFKAYEDLWSIKSVLPGTPYEFDSGGDPEYILNLSWEDLKDFHRTWYSPANCRIFLAGNIPTEKQLAFLDEKFFSSLLPGNRNAPIPKVKRWTTPRSYRIPCPAGTGQKPTVLLSWLCGDVADIDETDALAFLSNILLKNDSSPLVKALTDSGLVEGLSSTPGIHKHLQETVFYTVIRGLWENTEEFAKKIEVLILGELERLEREGIPKEEIEAALLAKEFPIKSFRGGGGLGLFPSRILINFFLDAWLHGGKPWDGLSFTRSHTKLRKLLEEDNNYFEKMIRRYLLDNPHRAFTILEPAEGFLEEKEAAIARHLEEIEKSLGAEAKDAIRNRAAELKRIQEKEDDPEVLAAIPHLSRSDIDTEIEITERVYSDALSVPFVFHLPSSMGITQIDLAFPLDVFSPEDYLWLPFFKKAVVSMGLPGMDYSEVTSLITKTIGIFNSCLYSSRLALKTVCCEDFPTWIHDIWGRDWIIFHFQVLDEIIAPSLDLVLRLITEADFSDLKRLKDLAIEMKNDLDSSLVPAANSYASSFSSRLFSRSNDITELWYGLEQIFFSHRLAKLDASEISLKLKAMQMKLTGAGVIINLKGCNPEETLREIEKYFGSFGPPCQKNPTSQDWENFSAIRGINHSPDKAVVFTSPSLQVGFAAISFKGEIYGSPLKAAEIVLCDRLITGIFWDDIRIKGGAYNIFVETNPFGDTISFSSYRDPNPLRTLEVFSSRITSASVETLGLDGKAQGGRNILDNSVIRIYTDLINARLDGNYTDLINAPFLDDFLKFLIGIDDKRHCENLKDILAVTPEKIDAVLKRMATEIRGVPNQTHPVIIADKAQARKAAKKLNAEIINLP
jgi:Zn-dependent M16 (insulinase) family peptidase